MPDFPAPTTVAIPAFVFFVLLEWWAVRTGRAAGAYDTKDAVTSLAMGLGNVAVNTATGFLGYAAFLALWPYRIYEFPVTWWSIALCFVINDFFYYWKHRFAHRVRFWWAEHVTHHSSEFYNLTTALRQPWYGPLTGLILLGLPMVAMGFHPAVIFFSMGLNLVYQFWIHTETIDRMPGWFEAVFNTPSHHRVHHGRNPRYLDANYAGVLIIWDKMFGTFVPELKREKPDYGLVTPLRTHNPLVVAYHELAALIGDCRRDGLKPWRWAARFAKPPGWAPDGGGQTSRDLKLAFVQQNPSEARSPGLPTRPEIGDASPDPQGTEYPVN